MRIYASRSAAIAAYTPGSAVITLCWAAGYAVVSQADAARLWAAREILAYWFFVPQSGGAERLVSVPV